MLRLTVDEQAWRAHVDGLRATIDGLVPVVKGNGYGLGRAALADLAVSMGCRELAVGTVHELADVHAATRGADVRLVSLTPAVHLATDLPASAVLTVASALHVRAARDHGHRGAVAVKLESSMHRHGVSRAALDGLLTDVSSAGLTLHQHVLHLPMPSATYAPSAAVAEIEGWLPRLDPAVPLSLSHLDAATYRQLRARHADRSFRLRVGTALWHGDKAALHLTADVLDVRPVRAGEQVGYRQVPVLDGGHLVMIGAGSAHGVLPLDGGLSPFHHARQRMHLVEPPHMHTSMAFVPDGAALPAPGEWVDVQRPLISVAVDELEWR